MVHAGCVFVAGIHLSRTWMSGCFESVRWNACVHGLDLASHSHPNESLGNGVRIHVNSKGKITSTKCSEEDWTYETASGRTGSPTHYQPSYSGPKIWDWTSLSPRVESHQWLTSGTLLPTLPDTWCYRVSANTDWHRVSIVRMGGRACWISNFYLSMAAHTTV